MPRGRVLSDVEVDALREEARNQPPGSLQRFAKEHARLLGCHWSTIYRAIGDEQPAKKKRKRRSDKGMLKALEQEAMDDVAAMVVQFDYDAELAIDTYNADRVKKGLTAVDVHPETVRRHLREMGVSRRHNQQDLRVHRRFEAPYPGYMFQLDSTVAQQYFIDVDDSIGFEATVVLNKNKTGNQRQRIWLLGGIDDHSRVRYGRFYTSNSAIAWHDFMLRCWRGLHPDPLVWPAYGVHERVYSDQDSAMKSAIVKRSLESLGVQRMMAMPSTEHETNAQAKGKAEACLRILQTFEKVSRWVRFTSLEEMNEALLKHLIWLNNKRHSQTKETPFERWLRAEHVTVLPPAEITRRMSFREDQRKVSSAVTIQLGGKTYQLPHRAPFIDFVQKTVSVLYLEADLSKITVVLNGEEHEVEATEALPDTAGDFKQAPVPASVAKKRELQQHNLGHIDPHAVRDFRVEKDQRVYPIRPREVAHPLSGELLAPRMVKRGKVIDRLQKEGYVGTPPTAEQKAQLDALFGERGEIDEREIAQFIETLRTGAPARRAEQA